MQDEQKTSETDEVIVLPAPEKEPDESLQPKEEEIEVTISLRYWNSNSQCLSDWQAKELKKLAKVINKAQKLTETQLKTDQTLGWKMHSGSAKGGFSKPSHLSKEIKLSELRVDGKARIHGALMNNVFYLVWLDRSHEVFPQ